KGLRSLEVGMPGFGKVFEPSEMDRDNLIGLIRKPNSKRMFYLREAFIAGMTLEEIFDITKIDPWYLHQFEDLVTFEKELRQCSLETGLYSGDERVPVMFKKAKEYGYSDPQLATMWRE
ncbi:carbamoyl-phosphate synthase large subunit, partial [Aduncisulcus paluster]